MTFSRVGPWVAAGVIAALAPATGSAQIAAGFSCVGGICDIVDLTFTAPTPQVFSSLTLTNTGFPGFVFQDLGFGGQINEVGPPYDDGVVPPLPMLFWTGLIGGGGITLVSSACAPGDPSFALCRPTDPTTTMTIRVFFEQIPALGTPDDFRANLAFEVVADGVASSGDFVAGPAVVPEPMSVALLASGLAVLGAVGRRRARRS